MEFLKKNKEKKNKPKKLEKKYVDKFIYVFLTIFICLCLYFRLKFWQISIIAVLFSIIIFCFYLGKYKLKTNSLINKDGIKQKIETLTEEETLNLLRFYYEERGYIVDFDSFKPIVRKNNHTYRLFIILKPINITNQDFLYITSYKKNVDGIIIVTNQNLTKEQREKIKEKGIYTITKEGLINIYQDFLRNIDIIDTRRKRIKRNRGGN